VKAAWRGGAPFTKAQHLRSTEKQSQSSRQSPRFPSLFITASRQHYPNTNISTQATHTEHDPLVHHHTAAICPQHQRAKAHQLTNEKRDSTLLPRTAVFERGQQECGEQGVRLHCPHPTICLNLRPARHLLLLLNSYAHHSIDGLVNTARGMVELTLSCAHSRAPPLPLLHHAAAPAPFFHADVRGLPGHTADPC